MTIKQLPYNTCLNMYDIEMEHYKDDLEFQWVYQSL